jgi:hypothetical protein
MSESIRGIVVKKNIVFIFSICALSVWVAGCAPVAPTSSSYIGPSGKSVTTVKCNQTPEGCFVEANKICQGPYSVLNSESHAGGTHADYIPGPVTWYGMTIECGDSNGVQPRFPFMGSKYTPAPIVITQPQRVRLSCTTIGAHTNCS